MRLCALSSNSPRSHISLCLGECHLQLALAQKLILSHIKNHEAIFATH